MPALESRDPSSGPDSATSWLSDLGQIASPLWASVSSVSPLQSWSSESSGTVAVILRPFVCESKCGGEGEPSGKEAQGLGLMCSLDPQRWPFFGLYTLISTLSSLYVWKAS